MALLHSRVRRVIYAKSNPLDGSLGSIHKINCHPNLNHHFRVFKVQFQQSIHSLYFYGSKLMLHILGNSRKGVLTGS